MPEAPAQLPNHRPATVMVFTKTPELGRVKTRLALSWGEEQALLCYEHLVELTLQKVADSGLAKQLHIAGPLDHPFWHDALKAGWKAQAQRGANLGERMFNACSGRRSILLGCDFPGLSAELLQRVEQHLNHFDLAAVPATDGGYVLLAMNNPSAALFAGIPWGSDSVWADTQRVIEQLHLNAKVLPPQMDLDTAEDWQAAEREGLLGKGLNTPQ